MCKIEALEKKFPSLKKKNTKIKLKLTLNLISKLFITCIKSAKIFSDKYEVLRQAFALGK